MALKDRTTITAVNVTLETVPELRAFVTAKATVTCEGSSSLVLDISLDTAVDLDPDILAAVEDLLKVVEKAAIDVIKCGE
jgi:hypothetical protein